MAEIPLSYDSSHLDQLSALKAEQRALAELSNRAAAHRDKVAEVYARVVRDYEARIQALEGQAETLRQLVHAEFVTLDEAYGEAGRLLDQARFQLQENEFRRDIGEFSEEEFGRRVAAIEQEIVDRQRELDRIGTLREKYLGLLPGTATAVAISAQAPAAPVAVAVAAPATVPVPQARVTLPAPPPVVAAALAVTPDLTPAIIPAFDPGPEPAPDPVAALEALPTPTFEPQPAVPPVLASGSFAGLSLPGSEPPPLPPPTFPPPLEGLGNTAPPVDQALTGATRVLPADPDDNGGTRALPPDDDLNTGATRVAGGDVVNAGGTVMLSDAGVGTGETRVLADEGGVDEAGSTRLISPSAATTAVPVARVCLLVEQRPDGSTVEHLLGDHTTIGRWSGNEIVLNSHEVSRRHAEIVREGDAFTLRDYKTPNRTYVNDGPVLECQLRDGDRIAIGTHFFVFTVR
jgi:hypothetical protein